MDQVRLVRCDLERGSELPAIREFDAGREVDAAAEVTRGIEHNCIPGQIDDPRREGNPAFRLTQGSQVLEFHIERLDTRRDSEMKRINIYTVAHPGNPLAVGCDDKSSQFRNWSGW